MNRRIELPDWPAQRLVRESVLAWNLRHPDGDTIDPDNSPWHLIRIATLGFLRHQLSLNDDQLRARCEYDKTYRDQLALELEQAAVRKYPWLSHNPRPFPLGEKCLLLDGAARELAQLHSLQDHLASALRELKRNGKKEPEYAAALQAELARTKAKIQQRYTFLTIPMISRDENDSYGRSMALPLENTGNYYFFRSGKLPPNRLNYLGFKCRQCGASVARLKGFVDLGQRYNRMIVASCHCLAWAAYQPPGFRLAPLTVSDWQDFVNDNANPRKEFAR